MGILASVGKNTSTKIALTPGSPLTVAIWSVDTHGNVAAPRVVKVSAWGPGGCCACAPAGDETAACACAQAAEPVDPAGLEPAAFAMPSRRSPN